ncbi:MAG: VOC family protein [Chromatiales bacterium]|jgi:predicted enzyme related to lactoylglutathione lyase
MKPGRESAPYASKLGLLLAIITVVTLAGCATNPPWPAIAEGETTKSVAGRWVWAELFTSEIEKARAFYGDVFGWQFETRGTSEKPYVLVRNEGSPVAGMVRYPATDEDVLQSRWVGLLSVNDVDATTDSIRKAGGEVLLDPVTLRGRGDVALVADPEGARFGLLATESGDPPDAMPEPGRWLWHELWANSASKATDFYRQTVGYSIKPTGRARGKIEQHLVSGGYPRAGIIQYGMSGLPSAWLHYVRVTDVQQAVERVRKAGGSVLIAPTREFRKGRAAVIVDPMGAPLGIAEWPEEKKAGEKG